MDTETFWFPDILKNGPPHTNAVLHMHVWTESCLNSIKCQSSFCDKIVWKIAVVVTYTCNTFFMSIFDPISEETSDASYKKSNSLYTATILGNAADLDGEVLWEIAVAATHTCSTFFTAMFDTISEQMSGANYKESTRWQSCRHGGWNSMGNWSRSVYCCY